MLLLMEAGTNMERYLTIIDTACPSLSDCGGKVPNSASAISSEEASTSRTTPNPIRLNIDSHYVRWGGYGFYNGFWARIFNSLKKRAKPHKRLESATLS